MKPSGSFRVKSPSIIQSKFVQDSKSQQAFQIVISNVTKPIQGIASNQAASSSNIQSLRSNRHGSQDRIQPRKNAHILNASLNASSQRVNSASSHQNQVINISALPTTSTRFRQTIHSLTNSEKGNSASNGYNLRNKNILVRQITSSRTNCLSEQRDGTPQSFATMTTFEEVKIGSGGGGETAAAIAANSLVLHNSDLQISPAKLQNGNYVQQKKQQQVIPSSDAFLSLNPQLTNRRLNQHQLNFTNIKNNASKVRILAQSQGVSPVKQFQNTCRDANPWALLNQTTGPEGFFNGLLSQDERNEMYLQSSVNQQALTSASNSPERRMSQLSRRNSISNSNKKRPQTSLNMRNRGLHVHRTQENSPSPSGERDNLSKMLDGTLCSFNGLSQPGERTILHAQHQQQQPAKKPLLQQFQEQQMKQKQKQAEVHSMGNSCPIEEKSVSEKQDSLEKQKYFVNRTSRLSSTRTFSRKMSQKTNQLVFDQHGNPVVNRQNNNTSFQQLKIDMLDQKKNQFFTQHDESRVNIENIFNHKRSLPHVKFMHAQRNSITQILNNPPLISSQLNIEPHSITAHNVQVHNAGNPIVLTNQRIKIQEKGQNVNNNNNNGLISEKPSTSTSTQSSSISEHLDQYEMMKEIGTGSYAVVRLAIDKQSHEYVAIKVYEKEKLLDPHKKRNVMREIDILKRVNHQNIIKLYQVVDLRDTLNLVMEYIGSESLYSYLKEQPNRRLKEAEGKFIFRQVIEGIKYLHEFKVVHRDIKLENILVDSKKRIKLIDFGFAVQTEPDRKLTSFCGTPSYMPPEIVSKRDYYGPPVDIWAAGVLLYVLFCGAFPFKGQDEKDLFKKIQLCQLEIPSHVPVGARNLILKIIRPNPRDRLSLDEILSDIWLQESYIRSSSFITSQRGSQYSPLSRR